MENKIYYTIVSVRGYITASSLKSESRFTAETLKSEFSKSWDKNFNTKHMIIQYCENRKDNIGFNKENIIPIPEQLETMLKASINGTFSLSPAIIAESNNMDPVYGPCRTSTIMIGGSGDTDHFRYLTVLPMATAGSFRIMINQDQKTRKIGRSLVKIRSDIELFYQECPEDAYKEMMEKQYKVYPMIIYHPELFSEGESEVGTDTSGDEDDYADVDVSPKRRADVNITHKEGPSKKKAIVMGMKDAVVGVSRAFHKNKNTNVTLRPNNMLSGLATAEGDTGAQQDK